MTFLKSLQKVVTALATAVIVFSVVSFSGSGVATAKADTALPADTDSSLQLDAKAAIAVDANTGQILYAKNADQALPVASMSKLMTAYMVLQAINNGKLKWDQKVTPGKAAQEVSQDTTLSNVPLKEGHSYTVRELYQATLIYSANGAAMALADAVGGTQKNFIDLARKGAKKMGLKDVELYTANGLANGEVKDGKYPGAADDAENKFSAKDMALLSQRLIKDYPEVLKTTKITRMKFNNGTDQTEMENWNWMLPGLAKAYSELPVDGLKTGTSDSAGACFAATVNKDGHRLITIVLGAKHDSQEDLSRFEETQKLMSYCYNNYTYTSLAKGTTFKKTNALPVYHGKDLDVKVSLAAKTDVWLKSGVSKDQLSAKAVGNKKLYKKDGLQAPLKKGQKVGTLQIKAKDQAMYFLDGTDYLSADAQTTTEVKKANIFVIGWRAITSLF